jgi:predicted enzyme related to lactoylglutathione lyase
MRGEKTMANPFSYVELHTQNPDQALSFYRRLFDWKTNTSSTPGGDYTQLEPGEGFPGGLLATKNGAPSAWTVYMKVDDVDAHTKRAAELGAKVLIGKTEVPDAGWFTLCTDPTGATFGLWQPMPGKK